MSLHSRGLVKHTVAFLVSTCFAILGSLLLLIGASIWTVAIKRVNPINALVVARTSIPLGISISIGSGLYMIWAAFTCLLLSTVPYMLRYECSMAAMSFTLTETIFLFSAAAHTEGEIVVMPVPATITFTGITMIQQTIY